MHNPKPVLEKEMQKQLLDFTIQTDYLIWVRPTDLVIINKKTITGQIPDFSVPADHWVKFKENKKKHNT